MRLWIIPIASVLLALLPSIHAVSLATNTTCPQRTVLTSDCARVCPGFALCTKYRGSYSSIVDRASFSTTFNVDANDCVFLCKNTTIDAVTNVLHVRLRGYDMDTPEDARDGSSVEDIAALSLPENVTGLYVVAILFYQRLGQWHT
jgi:hypothetical protein